jgi:hypothetical protein
LCDEQGSRWIESSEEWVEPVAVSAEPGHATKSRARPPLGPACPQLASDSGYVLNSLKRLILREPFSYTIY